MMSSRSAIVEMTGWAVAESNSVELASGMPARLRAASITMHCRPRQRPSSGICVLAGVLYRADLARHATVAELPGMQIAVDVAELLLRRPPGLAVRPR